MSPISRGFTGRRHPAEDPSRIPPGQYLTTDFPVLSAGPTPHTPLDEWSFTIHGSVEEPVSWPWSEFLDLPAETVTVSKLSLNTTSHAVASVTAPSLSAAICI